MLALKLPELSPAFEHAIEFVDQQRDSLVAVLRVDCGVEIRALDFDVAFGGETRDLSRIAFKFEAKSHDAVFMTKQSGGFLLHERLQRRREVQVNAGNNDFVMI